MVTDGTAKMLNARELPRLGTVRAENGERHLLDLEARAFDGRALRCGLETE